MHRYAMVGAQGVGKGVQAARLAAAVGVPHLSSGELFRREIASGSPLGRRLDGLMRAGALVPDETTVEVVLGRLVAPDCAVGWVLDGFPRNLAQAEALDAMLAGIGRGLDAILFFDLPHDVALERMQGRASLEGREDDNAEAMRRRLAIYDEQTVPVVEHYRATGKLVPLRAARPIDAVWAEIEAALDTVGTR